MHPQTLRLYEARRLVVPRRSAGGRRLYSDADLARLQSVKALTTALGLNHSGVEHVLAARAGAHPAAGPRRRARGRARRAPAGACARRGRARPQRPARARRLAAALAGARASFLTPLFLKDPAHGNERSVHDQGTGGACGRGRARPCQRQSRDHARAPAARADRRARRHGVGAPARRRRRPRRRALARRGARSPSCRPPAARRRRSSRRSRSARRSIARARRRANSATSSSPSSTSCSPWPIVSGAAARAGRRCSRPRASCAAPSTPTTRTPRSATTRSRASAATSRRSPRAASSTP